METTPTLSSLAFANQELEAVKDVCLSIGLEAVEPERRKAALIDQLRQCKFFHFAGHGCTDISRPAEELFVSRRCRDESTAGRWSTGLESKGLATFSSISVGLWNGPYPTGAVHG